MPCGEDNCISIKRKGDSSEVEEKTCNLHEEDEGVSRHSTTTECSYLQPIVPATLMSIAMI